MLRMILIQPSFPQGKCSKCKKQIKNYNGITGLHCRWCHLTVREKDLLTPASEARELE